MANFRVDKLETDVQEWPVSLPPQTALQESTHERHWDTRRKIILAIAAGYGNHHYRTATRLAYCCNGAALFVDPALGKVKPWISRCHHRMCPYCARTRSRRVAEQLLEILHRLEHPRVMILTVKSVDRPLGDQLRMLRRCFAALRRRKYWKDLVTGGAYTLEITLNKKTGLWHPHVHIIYDGKYFPQPILRKMWHDVTGSAAVVWLEKLRDFKGAARELTKYIGAPQRVADFTPVQIRNYADAVTGSRMLQTFGNVWGLKLEDKDEPDTESPDTYQVKISRLVHLAFQGAETPQRLLVLIAQRWTMFRSYIYHQLPKLERPPSIGDRLRRRLAVLEGRPPPAAEDVTATIDIEKLDSELFTTFCRFRADERADVFTDLEFQGLWAP